MCPAAAGPVRPEKIRSMNRLSPVSVKLATPVPATPVGGTSLAPLRIAMYVMEVACAGRVRPRARTREAVRKIRLSIGLLHFARGGG